MENRDVICSSCEEPRSSDVVGVQGHSPCPKCGGTAITTGVHLHDTVRVVADEISIKLKPGIQDRDWKQRWKQIQSDLAQLKAPQTKQMSADTIHREGYALQSFYIHAYHLKDALIIDAASLGLSKSTIESAISGDADLALLADLANLDKHGALTKPPRSGHVPQIKEIAAQSNGNNGWRLALKIQHNSREIDGVTFAESAVAAWRKVLSSWGIT